MIILDVNHVRGGVGKRLAVCVGESSGDVGMQHDSFHGR